MVQINSCACGRGVISGKDERNLGLTYILKQYVCLLSSPGGDRGPPESVEEGGKDDEIYGTARNG